MKAHCHSRIFYIVEKLSTIFFSINHAVLNNVEFKINKKKAAILSMKTAISLIKQTSKTIIFICTLTNLQALSLLI